MPAPATLAAGLVALVWLAHTTAIDRLEVTKLAVALLLATVATLLVARRRLRTPILGFFGVALLATSLLAPDFVAARVEAWAPWVAAGLVFGLVRGADVARVAVVVTVASVVLAALGLAQALGADWFVGDVRAFAGRPVMATLGNPSIYGVCLAGALPFAVVVARRGDESRGWVGAVGLVALVLMVAAIALSGSRTAWVMVVPSLLLAARGGRVGSVLAFGAAGLGLAALIALGSPAVDVDSRLADMGDAGGTAAGRLYLWSVHPRLVLDAGPIGGGPGAFQREWPGAQASYLAEHPDEVGFASDLRHAHADVVELAVDFGWIGLLLAGWWGWRLLRPRAAAAPGARASVVALLIGGLAMPVLFQTPTLLLAALSAGLLVPGARVEPVGRLWVGAAAVGLALTLYWAGQRTVSEVVRNDGLRAELAGRLDNARDLYGRAAELDPTNPLAQWMVARSQLATDPRAALEAATAAVRELPVGPLYALRAMAAEAVGETAMAAESWAAVERLTPVGPR